MSKPIINYIVIISFLLFSSPSFSMMDCNGSGFYCDDYKNGTILCRPTSFTCQYQPEDQWSWAATGFTYAFASAVFSFTLDRLWEICKKRLYGDEESLLKSIRDRPTGLKDYGTSG